MPFIAGTKPEQIAPMGLVRRIVSWTILRMRLLPVYSLEEFRQTRFMLGKAVLISDATVFGIFRRDDSDTTTADDGQDCILTADDLPVRFKRRILLRKYTPTSGTDTSMETGSMVYDADFLHVKTGASTIQKIQFPKSGTTAQRPATASLPVPFLYYDTTLGKPIWWNGANWKDATGATV